MGKGGSGIGGKCALIFSRIFGITWTFLRFLFLFFIVWTFSIGLCCIYDIVVGDTVPDVYQRPFVNFDRSTIFQMEWPHEDLSLRWEDCSKSLKILDSVCPEASIWVRDRYKKGKLEFSNDRQDLCASYNFFTGKLVIYDYFFRYPHGDRASILAHEYRHSRQNLGKVVRYLLCRFLIWRKNTVDIIETDAYLFEERVRKVINSMARRQFNEPFE